MTPFPSGSPRDWGETVAFTWTDFSLPPAKKPAEGKVRCRISTSRPSTSRLIQTFRTPLPASSTDTLTVRVAPIKGESSPISRAGTVPSIRMIASHTAGILISSTTMITRVGLMDIPFLFNDDSFSGGLLALL
jgi:hypothetical protein